MKDGTPYQVQLCIEPDTPHTADLLKSQIVHAMSCMSSQSRWQRFASSVNSLSDEQLDYLTDLDGKDRVAWCASIRNNNDERGIGLARYIRLNGESNIAEFALTVLDEYQGQGIGYVLLDQLVETARDNGLEILRGYILPSNKHMLSLCKRFAASLDREDLSFVIADIPVAMGLANK
ncbi:MAG: GNAT family N-acetyltransferase [Gammaproteobacteria bacterium]